MHPDIENVTLKPVARIRATDLADVNMPLIFAAIVTEETDIAGTAVNAKQPLNILRVAVTFVVLNSGTVVRE